MAVDVFNTGSYAIPRVTATGATPFTHLIPPLGPRSKVKIADLIYENGATAHTVAFLVELARVTVVTAQVAGDLAVVLSRDPGSYAAAFASGLVRQPAAADNLIAANDYIAVYVAAGYWWTVKVTAVATNAAGQVTCTIAAVPTGGIPVGAPVVFFGVTGDTSPLTGKVNTTEVMAATTTTTLGSASGLVMQADLVNSPVLFYSPNTTNAGILHRGTAFGAP